ncbi:MAG: TraX family protein [Lachnospiraceae bacterium]
MRKLSRDGVKYLAAFAMVFNHVANAGLVPEGTVLHDAFVNIGYVTAITMCWFLVEGFYHTHSIRRYLGRLLLFAAIAQIPYMNCLNIVQLDMLFSLALCLLLLCVLVYVPDGVVRQLLVLLLFGLSLFTDWAVLAPLFTAVFARYRNDKRALAIAWPVLSALVGLTSLPAVITPYGICNAVFAGLAPLLAGFVVQYGCSGEPAKSHHKFHKWFFYIFYPAHLTIIWIIKMAVGL